MSVFFGPGSFSSCFLWTFCRKGTVKIFGIVPRGALGGLGEKKRQVFAPATEHNLG